MRGKRQKLICDTSFVGHLARRVRNPAPYAHWEAAMDRVDACEPAVSVVTLAETRAGFLSAGWGLPRIVEVERRLGRFDLLSVRRSYADEWARLRVGAQAKGLSLSDNDLWVAATANILGHDLVTCDRDHTRIAPQLDIEVVYLQPPV
jgi:predicted nucleic acid-binding protein